MAPCSSLKWDDSMHVESKWKDYTTFADNTSMYGSLLIKSEFQFDPAAFYCPISISDLPSPIPCFSMLHAESGSLGGEATSK